MCRGKPEPELAYLAPALPHLERLLHVQDHNTLSEALWCFKYLTAAGGPALQAVIETGAVAQMVPQYRPLAGSAWIPFGVPPRNWMARS